jgi:CheY-like chemotaxis protein
MEARETSEPSWYALVADDDDDNRSLMASVLRNARMSVCEAANGEELVERYRALKTCSAGRLVVVSDIEMPCKDGIEATKELRTLSRSMPIVLMTGFTDAHVADAAQDAGANALLPKPVKTDGLLRMVEGFRAHGAFRD